MSPSRAGLVSECASGAADPFQLFRILHEVVKADAVRPPDPVAAYLASGYGEKIISARQGGSPAGWGA